MPGAHKSKSSAKHRKQKVSKAGQLSKANLAIFAFVFSLFGTYVILRSFADPIGYTDQPFSVDYIESTVGKTNLMVGAIAAAVLIFVIVVGPSRLLKPFRSPVRSYAGADPSNKPTIMPRRAMKNPVTPQAAAAPPPPPVAVTPKREIPLVPGATIMPTEGPDDK